MNGPALLADHIDARSEEILAIWRAEVERAEEVPEARKLSSRELLDHIPELLDRLRERLRGWPADHEETARKHGRIRWDQGYDINEVVRELSFLRSALHRACFQAIRERRLEPDVLETALAAVDEVIDEAIAASVEQFERESVARAHSERARQETLLEHLPIGVWVVDAEGTVVSLNRAAAEMHGVPAERIIGHLNVNAVLTPEFATYRPDGTPYGPGEIPSARALRGEAVRGEEVVRRSSRGERRLVINAVPLRGPEGQPEGAVAIALDVTDGMRAESVLARYKLLSEHGRDIILFIRPEDLRIVEANDAAVAAYGYDRETLLSMTIADLRAPETRREIPAQFARAQAEGILFESVHVRRDGRAFPVEVSARAADVGPDRLILSIVRDLTDRRLAERALREREELLRLATHATGLGAWDLDPHTGVLQWSDQCRAIFGLGPDEPVDYTRFLSLLHPDDRVRTDDAVAGALDPAGDGRYEIDYRIVLPDGAERWVNAKGRALFEDTPSGRRATRFIGTALDITDRKQLVAELERRRAAAEEASLHKTRLLTALSHDARTPLNAVVLSSELLEMHARDSRDPEVAESLQTIRHSVHNVLDLLNDLLDLTRIDSGALPPEPSRFELAPALRECLASIEGQARRKGLACRLDLDGFTDCLVDTDRAKLKQILSNFLSNALRYTERGHIRLYCEQTEDRLLISVEDTGVGIAPADQGRIFDEFARLDQPRRPIGEGTGLGLAICRRLANLLRGEIRLRSEPGAGSTFSLALPMEIVTPTSSDPGPAKPASPPPTGDGAAESGSILVAEDHEPSRIALSRILRRLGYRVLEAENGREALALARVEIPSAVLMDVNMPVMDGIEATLAFREDPRLRDVTIFALTGDVSPTNQSRIGEAGVQGYLDKPVTFEALRRALATLDGRASAMA